MILFGEFKKAIRDQADCQFCYMFIAYIINVVRATRNSPTLHNKDSNEITLPFSMVFSLPLLRLVETKTISKRLKQE